MPRVIPEYALADRRITFDLDEVSPPQWETPLPEPPAEKPRIRIPGPNRTISQFSGELALHIKHVEPYFHGDKMFAPNASSGNYQEVTPAKLVTWIEEHVVCVEGEVGEDGDGGTPRSITTSLAQAVLASEQFRSLLPQVRRLHEIREPVFDKDGGLQLLPTGYDERTGTLTARGGLQYALDMPVEVARRTLHELLAEFPFVDLAQGEAMQVSAMLTSYGMGLLSETCVIPAFIYNSNAEGAGKGLLVKAAVLPVMGRVSNTSPVKSEAEMEKRLFATARAGERFFVLDNMEVPIKSGSLEMFITSSTYSGRVLGTSRNEVMPKKTVTFITGNHLTISPDMRRRSLVIEQFMRPIRSEARHIQRPLDEQVILAQRPQILAALYALIREWVDANKPPPSRTHPSFVEWSNVIAAIVEHAGFANPIPTFEHATIADPRTADMERLVQAMRGQSEIDGLTFSQVVELCKEHDLFEEELPTSETSRKANTSFSRLLKRYNGREFPGRLLFSLRGTGHARRYHVVDVTDPAQPATAEPRPEAPDPVQMIADVGQGADAECMIA